MKIKTLKPKIPCVLITGTSRGIGEALAYQYCELEYSVIASYKTTPSPKLKLIAKRQKSRLQLLKLDVTKPKDFKKLDRYFMAGIGPDIIINNAGILGPIGALIPKGNSELEKVFKVNCVGAFNVVNYFQSRIDNSQMKLVQVSSAMGSIGQTNSCTHLSYRISKAALNMFAKSLAIRFPRSIAIALHPGWVRTRMGGAGTTLSSQQSAKMIIGLINQLQPKDSGSFLDLDRTEIPW